MGIPRRRSNGAGRGAAAAAGFPIQVRGARLRHRPRHRGGGARGTANRATVRSPARGRRAAGYGVGRGWRRGDGDSAARYSRSCGPDGLLHRPLGGDQSRVSRLCRFRRVPAPRVLAAGVRGRWASAFVEGRDRAVRRPNGAARAIHVGSGPLSCRSRRLSCGRRQLVRGHGIRPVPRGTAAERLPLDARRAIRSGRGNPYREQH